LLGVRAVVAESFERIHRSNLVGMGVLPLEFAPGTTVSGLGLDGTEAFDILGLSAGLAPGLPVTMQVRRADGRAETVALRCRLDTRVEVEWLESGGILPHALRSLVSQAEPVA
jgi:aconitate hydratase